MNFRRAGASPGFSAVNVLGCFCKFGVLFVGVLIIRALLFGVYIGTLIFGTSLAALALAVQHLLIPGLFSS